MTSKLTIQTFPNEAAAAYIRGKAVADPKNFGALPDQLKQRAFVVAGIERLDAVKRIRDAVAKLPEGASWDEAKKAIAAEMSPYTAGDMKAARARAEFTLRMQGFQAYAVARHQQQMSGMASHPYWKYETVGDSRVRAGHAKLDGKVLRADDPWWDTHYPPWDWGCRCIVIALDEEDAQMYGISEHNDMPTPERSGSWSFNPSDAGISLDALTQGRDDADCRILFNGARNATVQRDDGTATTMWDYMVNRHMETKAKSLTSATERDGKERAIVIDYVTGKQIGNTQVGGANGVTPDIPAGKEIATLHTHPNGLNIPSPGDMLFGSETMSKAEYVAIGKKVRRWQWLKKPNDDDIAILKMYDADNNSGGVNLDAYLDVIDRLVREGYIKMEELS